jgi:peroxiredoxin
MPRVLMQIKPLPHLLLFLLIALAGCSPNGNRFTITGEIRNMPPQRVLLEELGIHDITILDSARSDANGNFTLSGIAPEPGLYRLSFQDNQYIILSLSDEQVKVVSDWQTLYDYEVTGSAASANLQEFLRTVRRYARDLNTITGVIRTLHERGNDSLLATANDQMKEINFQLTRFIEHYADTSTNLPNALFAVQILNPATEQAFLEAFTQTLPRRFANARLARDFTEKCNRILREQAERASHVARGKTSEPTAPDFSLSTPNGQQVSLSSFKGKYVLLDFWASWCAPCRAENPNVVAAYQKFKDKNFTVLGVSLDEKKEAWEKAIKDDGLVWTNVSDLRGWDSEAARMYQVESIPANFLIDPEGRIIASNLRGAALAAHLETILK